MLTKSQSLYITKPEYNTVEKSKSLSIISLSNNTAQSYNGQYGYYYKADKQFDGFEQLTYPIDNERQYIKIMKKLSKDNSSIMLQPYCQIHNKQKYLTKLFPLSHLIATKLLSTIHKIELIKTHNERLMYGSSNEICMNGKQLLFKDNKESKNKLLINLRYNFIISSIDMEDIIIYINTIRIIFNTTTDDEDLKRVYEGICNKMINLFRYAKEFEQKYKDILEHNNLMPVIFNNFDSENKNFLYELIAMYDMVIEHYLLNIRFNSVLSNKHISRFNKLVETNCVNYKQINIGLELWCDRSNKLAKK